MRCGRTSNRSIRTQGKLKCFRYSYIDIWDSYGKMGLRCKKRGQVGIGVNCARTSKGTGARTIPRSVLLTIIYFEVSFQKMASGCKFPDAWLNTIESRAPKERHPFIFGTNMKPARPNQETRKSKAKFQSHAPPTSNSNNSSSAFGPRQ